MKLNIPFISEMRIKEVGYNLWLLKFEILKKIRELTFFKLDPVDYLNDYLSKQLRRLRKHAKDPKRFWPLASLLLRRSKALRMLALRNVIPNWYKDRELKEVLKALKRLNRLADRGATRYVIREKEIPKADGSTRKISIAPVEWRMYAWMMNLLLHLYFENKLSEHQHGHRKGKGTLTCWRDILTNAIGKRFIYEFDLAKFHDSIQTEFLANSLDKAGVPLEWVRRLIGLQFARVKDEGVGMRYQEVGVPQGLNTSSLLGMIALEASGVYRIPGVTYIGYADDGILASDEPNADKKLKAQLDSTYTGIYVNDKKSGWLKVDGRWLRPLKLVGLLFDGKDLFASTRSGKTMRMHWTAKEPTRALNQIAKLGRLKVKDSPNEVLTWVTGWEHLGLLMNRVWRGKDGERRGLNWCTDSWMDLMVKSKVRMETASSKAFEWLRLHWKERTMYDLASVRYTGRHKGLERRSEVEGIKYVGTVTGPGALRYLDERSPQTDYPTGPRMRAGNPPTIKKITDEDYLYRWMGDLLMKRINNRDPRLMHMVPGLQPEPKEERRSFIHGVRTEEDPKGGPTRIYL